MFLWYSMSESKKKTFRDVLDPSWRIERKRLYASFILRWMGIMSAVTVSMLFSAKDAFPALRKFIRAYGIERKRLTRAMKQLERRGLVYRQRRDDGNEYLLLTEAGERAFLRERGRGLV